MEYKLYTSIYRKSNDCCNFLQYDSAHAKSLKDSIPFSQVLHIKQICTETSELDILKTSKMLSSNRAICLNFWSNISKEQCM